MLDQQVLIEKRIGPWINKKIMEYIGEEEPALTEFIINNVRGWGGTGGGGEWVARALTLWDLLIVPCHIT